MLVLKTKIASWINRMQYRTSGNYGYARPLKATASEEAFLFPCSYDPSICKGTSCIYHTILCCLHRRWQLSPNSRCHFKNKSILCQFRKLSQTCKAFVLKKMKTFQRGETIYKVTLITKLHRQTGWFCILSAISHCSIRKLHQ